MLKDESMITAQWWQWTLGECENDNPDYVFIKGGPAQGSDIHTTDTVSNGQYVIVSIINWIGFSKTKNWFALKAMLLRARDEIKDTIATIHSDMPYKYIESPYFSVKGQNAVSTGYWIIEQLPRGKHSLNTFGSCRSGAISISQTHDIEVI